MLGPPVPGRPGPRQPGVVVSVPGRSRPSPALTLWLIFGALSVAWGSSFLFIKIGVDEGLGPLTLVSFRLWIAVAFLGLILVLTGGRMPRHDHGLRKLVVLALINVAIPFTLITWGELWISSALTSILNGLVPLFVIVLAALLLRDEPMTANRLGGLLIGFAGAVLLVSPSLGAGEGVVDPGAAFLGELAVVVACISYACSAVYIRRVISGKALVDDPVRGPRAATPVEIALPQCIVATLITSSLALILERPQQGLVPLPPSLPAWVAVAWLGIVGSGLAYLLFFRLISAWGATRTSLVTYVMPIVGITLGVIILGERLDMAEVIGAALVIGGLVLANSSIGQRRLFGGGRTVSEGATARR